MAVPHTFDTTPWNVQGSTRTNHEAAVTHVEVIRNFVKTRYERTNRGAAQFFHPTHGELINYFPNWEHFSQSLQGKRVLDIGCGDGQFVQELTENKVTAYGLDLILNINQRKYPNIFLQGDIFHSPYPNQCFDVILSMYSVFYYEPNYRISSLIRECSRIAKPNAVLFLGPILNPYRRKEMINSASREGWIQMREQSSNPVMQWIRS